MASVAQRSERPSDAQEIAAHIAKAARFTRKHVIASIYHACSGHPGGALSCAVILACLFGAELNVWPQDIAAPQRDRFVLSKGHAAPALYAIAAHHGFCDARSALALCKIGSPFQGHPHIGDLPWVKPRRDRWARAFPWHSAWQWD